MEEYIGPLLTIFDCLTLGVGVIAAGGVGVGVIFFGASVFVQENTNNIPIAKNNFFIILVFNLTFGVVKYSKIILELIINSK
jgi:hypothetical protein